MVFNLIEEEHQRQLKGIELIASENFVSDQVMQAMGSCMTNKYAEGYPGRRYYGGCEVVDKSEQLAIERLNSSEPNGLTYSLTPAHRPTLPYSSPASIPATNSWDSTSPTADIFHTVRLSTHRVSSTPPANTI